MSKYMTKFYYSVDINDQKYHILESFAKICRLYRNELSKIVYDNYRYKLFYHTISEAKFMYETNNIRMNLQHNGVVLNQLGKVIGSDYYQCQQSQVFVNYTTHISKMNYKYKNCYKKSTYESIKWLVFNYRPEYIDSKWIVTNNSISLLIQYINKLIDESNSWKYSDQFVSKYQNKLKLVLKLITKFSSRLFNLILSIQSRLIKSIPLITYKKLTFRGMNVLSDRRLMIELSDNSYTNAVININLPNFNYKKYSDSFTKFIVIPTRYNKFYHEDLNSILSGLCGGGYLSRTGYTLQFIPNKKQIRVNLVLPDNREFSSISNTTDPTHTLGLDINTSRYLFALSDNTTFTYDLKLLLQQARLLKHIEKVQSNKQLNNNPLQYSKRIKVRLDKMVRRFKSHLERKIVELRRYLTDQAIAHLVIEDLNLYVGNGKNKFIHKPSGLTHTQIAKALHINDVKNVVTRILNKVGIMVSLVNPAYTSQQCPVCGNISKSNRTSQETFSCTKCGYTTDADINAAVNIKNRICDNRLRSRLMYYDKKNKRYVGYHYPLYIIKNILTSI